VVLEIAVAIMLESTPECNSRQEFLNATPQECIPGGGGRKSCSENRSSMIKPGDETCGERTRRATTSRTGFDAKACTDPKVARKTNYRGPSKKRLLEAERASGSDRGGGRCVKEFGDAKPRRREGGLVR
jgi:hypothetical protein